MKTVWILSDGRPGHYNQSLAVAEAIKEIEAVEVRYVEVKVKKFGKYLLRILLNSLLGRWILTHMFRPENISWFYEEIDLSEHPEIVISSGKDTSLLNALIGLWFGATTLFIGNPKKLDNKLFTKVLTVLDLGFNNQIVLDVAPTLPYTGNLENFCIKYGLDPNLSYHTLLIGGDGSGYHYTEEEIDHLIAFVNATAAQTNWLITTSRRTPEIFEEKMQDQMKSKMFIAYHKKPLKTVGVFLTLSQQVYVTEESASMVSEAVASGKAVVTLVPKQAEPENDYQKILEKFEEGKCIVRSKIEELSDLKDYPPSATSSVKYMQKLADQLKGYL